MKIFPFIAFSLFYAISGDAQLTDVLKMDTTKLSIDSLDQISLSFVGSGNFQGAFMEDIDMGSNAGLGMIFFRKWSKANWVQDLQLDLYISVASATDSLHAELLDSEIINRKIFGHYLLQPYNSRQSANFNMILYLNKDKANFITKWIHGLSARFYASNSTATFQEEKLDMTGVAMRFGLFHDFMPDRIRLNKSYSIIVVVDYSFRGLYGDLANRQNNLFRKAILGTSRTSFHGLEFYFGFQLKNIQAQVLLPIFNNKRGEVTGLTNTQFITTLRFVGGFPVFIDGYKEKNMK